MHALYLLHYHYTKYQETCFSWFQFTMQSIRPISFGSSDGIISTWNSKYRSNFFIFVYSFSKCTIRLNEGKKIDKASRLNLILSMKLFASCFQFDLWTILLLVIFACIIDAYRHRIQRRSAIYQSWKTKGAICD